MSLYSIRSIPELHGYVIHKFDEDWNVEAVYDLEPSSNLGGGWSCSCPAASRQSCRHRQMLPVFLAEGHVDDGAFFDFERRKWLPPLGVSEANVGTAASLEANAGTNVEPNEPAINEPATPTSAASVSPNEAPPNPTSPTTIRRRI